MDLQSKTPAQIDALWFPLMAKENSARDAQDAAEERVQIYKARRGYEDSVKHYQRAAAEAERAVNRLVHEQEPFRDEFAAREGWTRGYLVNNANGHVHRSTNCSTCYWNTRFLVLADCSGLEEAEIVALAGESACTICYPSAPVDVLNRPRRVFTADEKVAQAEKEQERAEREKRAKAKAAKAIFRPDGSPLERIGPHREYPKTEVSAERLATSFGADIQTDADHPYLPQWIEGYGILIEALAAKKGITQEEQEAETQRKVAAKIKRDAKEAEKYRAQFAAHNPHLNL